MFAPILLFTYNRLSETKQTVEALQKNYLASQSKLFIFSDGAKNFRDVQKVKDVREYIGSIDGFKSVKVFESTENKGLANSIIIGVTKIITEYGRVIILEDDLISTPNFLNFMNEALSFLPEIEQMKVSLLIVGRTSDMILEEEISDKVGKINDTTKCQVVWENKFVNESQMSAFFKQSDVVMIPYKNPEASSGILGHAMKYQKKVIGSSKGLIGGIIKLNELGIGLETISPIHIANAMINIQQYKNDTIKCENFVKEHTPNKFAKILLSNND